MRIRDRKGRVYLKYTLSTDLFNELKNSYSNPDVLSISIYLKTYNDVTKNRIVTRKYNLNREIYLAKTQFNIPIDKIKAINKTLDERY